MKRHNYTSPEETGPRAKKPEYRHLSPAYRLIGWEGREQMVTLLVSIGVLLASVLLFRAALPQQGKTRWFIGTPWEPYIVVALIIAFVVSLGLTMWSLIDLTA